MPAFFSELFPANLRYTGVACAREFGAIAGGVISLIAAALSAAYASAMPVAIFVIFMCVVTSSPSCWHRKRAAKSMQYEREFFEVYRFSKVGL